MSCPLLVLAMVLGTPDPELMEKNNGLNSSFFQYYRWVFLPPPDTMPEATPRNHAGSFGPPTRPLPSSGKKKLEGAGDVLGAKTNMHFFEGHLWHRVPGLAKPPPVLLLSVNSVYFVWSSSA